MKRITTMALAVVAVACLAAMLPGPVSAADAPADRVAVMYFHRTQRCPTCLKMGSYSEEAVKSGCVQQITDGKVAFHYVDFQDKKNAALAKGYRISGPALIVAKIAEGKVAKYKNLEEIWAKVGKKPAFLKYVQDEVNAHRQ